MKENVCVCVCVCEAWERAEFGVKGVSGKLM